MSFIFRPYILAAAIVSAIAGVAFAQVPSRIVMGGKAVALVADAVFAFPGARSKVVALPETDQGAGIFLNVVHPALKALPPFDRQAGPEAYLAFKPDLVILKSGLRTGVGSKLEALGVRTMYLSIETPEEWRADLTTLGRTLGEEARAAELVSYYDAAARRAEAAANASRAAGRLPPRVLLLQAAGDGFEAPPDSWIQTRMVEMAGGTAVWKGSVPGSGWAKVGPEQAAAWNPDVIVLASYRESTKSAVARLSADPRFAGLGAVKSGRVHAFPKDYLSWDQSDTRWGLGLLWVAATINPGTMGGYSAEAEARRFFELFYGIGKSDFDASIRPLLAASLQ